MTAKKVRIGMENRFEYVIAEEKLINENLGYYDSTVSVIRDMRFYADNPSQLDKLQKKFVGLTEGFSYTDLIGMRTLCYREHYRIAHLASVVDLYRYGIKENKWATVDRNTIDRLQEDMSMVVVDLTS